MSDLTSCFKLINTYCIALWTLVTINNDGERKIQPLTSWDMPSPLGGGWQTRDGWGRGPAWKDLKAFHVIFRELTVRDLMVDASVTQSSYTYPQNRCSANLNQMWSVLGPQHQPDKGRSPPALSGWGHQCRRDSLTGFTALLCGSRRCNRVGDLATCVEMELPLAKSSFLCISFVGLVCVSPKLG